MAFSDGAQASNDTAPEFMVVVPGTPDHSKAKTSTSNRSQQKTEPRSSAEIGTPEQLHSSTESGITPEHGNDRGNVS